MKIQTNSILNVKLAFDTKKNKEENALEWLILYHKYLIENKKAKYGDIIPNKEEIAAYLKISTGALQNALKYAEDMGYFTSKQRIGTMLKNPKTKIKLKVVSKKDKAEIEVKKFLIKHNYDVNEIIPSILELSNELKTSTNTVRLAALELVRKGILRKGVYKKKNVLILNSKIKPENIPCEVKNLSELLKEKIKKYLVKNFKTGDKIPTTLEFAKMFNASTRTINFAMRELNKEKFILSRRGKYGSIFLNSIEDTNKRFKKYNYKWEYALENMKNYILKNYDAGDKILSMKEFSKELDVSVTTIKHAVKELIALGVLYVQKGRYGGLFITEMPQKEDSYQWVIINPKYFD